MPARVCKLNVAGGAVAVVVVGFDVERVDAGARLDADDGYAAAVGGDLLVAVLREDEP